MLVTPILAELFKAPIGMSFRLRRIIHYCYLQGWDKMGNFYSDYVSRLQDLWSQAETLHIRYDELLPQFPHDTANIGSPGIKELLEYVKNDIDEFHQHMYNQYEAANSDPYLQDQILKWIEVSKDLSQKLNVQLIQCRDMGEQIYLHQMSH